MDKQQEIEKMAEIMQQGEIDREEGKIDCSEFALCAVVKNGMQRLAGATALINAGYGNVRAAVEDVAERIKMAFYYEFDELIPSIMTDKIDALVKEVCGGDESNDDRLIAAGIGDVSELKKHRVVVEKSLIPEDDNAYVLPNIPPTVKQIYSGEEVEQIVKEREEYKHRAKVVERALQKFAKNIMCVECPFFSDCVSPEKMEYPIHSNNCFAEYLRQTEKELAEEGK